jgi:glutamyl-Q tRNA(Asp) synthetase
MYRGRFAPTPSGELHMGSLVAAVASFLDARAAKGEWLVRIEDVDSQRSRIQFETAILLELERHGLHWDGEAVRQSQRIKYYDDALERLYRAGFVFRCSCSRSSLTERGCPINTEGEFVYPSICRNHAINVVPSVCALFDLPDVSFRFRVESEPTEFEDAWLGPQIVWVSREAGDFLLRRKDGCYAYHLAVVVDDYLQGVTHVVRGMDILPLTARQVLVQRALGFSTPVYKHCALVRSSDGVKLSKSASARALKETPAQLNLRNALQFLGIEMGIEPSSRCDEILARAAELWRQKFPPK